MDIKDIVTNGDDADKLEVVTDTPDDGKPLTEPVEVTAPEEQPRTALEFEFSDDEGGLVFISEENTPSEPAVSEDKAEKKAVEPPQEEFSVPERLPTDVAPTTPFITEEPMRIRTTYVPRFTEVSETYRMKDDPRPRVGSEPTVTRETGKSEPKTAEKTDKLDPTAEIDEGRESHGVVVTSSTAKKAEPSDESIKLYKFAAPTEVKDEVEAEEEPLIPPLPTDTEIVEDDPMPELTEDTSRVEEEGEPRGIPDPESHVRVIDFSSPEIEEDGPDGARDPRPSKHEFTSPIQRDEFKDNFLDRIMSVRVRFVAALLIFLALVAIEVSTLFGVEPMALIGLERVHYGAAVIDLEFSAALFILALPELIRAFRYLGKRVVMPELFLPVSLLVLVAYCIAVIADGSNDYITFGIIYSIQVLAAIGSAYYRITGDFLGFKTVTRNTVKNVLEKKLTRELPRENMALDGAVDEYNSKTARMFRTVFVSGFFRHAAEVAENSFNTLMIMGCGLGISLVSGAVSFFLSDNSALIALETFAMVFLLSAPAFSILAHKLPYNRACRLASSENSAFIGENAIRECADVDVIAYEDTEIFGVEDVSIKKVHLYGKAYNTPKAMKQMYSLFSVVGGPLDAVFTASLDRKCASATDIVIESDGISGSFEGHRIHAGTEEYMLRHKISIPAHDYRTKATATDSTKVMYGAEDGEVYVKFFVRYSFSEEFTMMLPYLKEQKIVPLIYTRDPNINLELLRILTMGEDVIRVMKKDTPRTAEERTYRHIDAAIVTLGDKSNAINMVLLAKKYTAFQVGLAVTELISMVVGAVLASVMCIGGMVSSSVPGFALWLALWQVAWVVVLAVRSRLSFRIGKN